MLFAIAVGIGEYLLLCNAHLFKLAYALAV